MDDEQGFPIEELARRAGLSVRNVRSHISRGLLPSGRMHGRAARFDQQHLDRLDLINGLRRRGFTLAAIEVLINQSAADTAEEALRLYRGMLAPWEPEDPVELAAGDLPGWLGVEPGDPAVADLDAAQRSLRTAGLIEQAGPGRVRVVRPGLVRAGAQAVRLGIPVDAVLELSRHLDVHTGRVAELFLELFRDQIWAGFVADGMPAGREPEVQNAVEQLQPVATLALLSAFRSQMQHAMDGFIAAISADLAPPAAARAVAIRTTARTPPPRA